jgi:AcrR family transcriptional regulator
MLYRPAGANDGRQAASAVLDPDGDSSLEGDVAGANKATANKLDTAGTILDAAERLCATHGIEAVSIRDIAAEAGVSISVIYHHYKSKANLLRAILHTRFGEIKEEHDRLLTELEAQKSPAVKDIVRAVLQPINQWRRPERQAALQFHALALVCQLPELKNAIDAGVVGLHRVVALLERALPGLTHEDICWRLHFTMKVTHLTRWDAARLTIMSKETCRSDDPEEALARGIAFAEAAFLAPPIAYPTKLANQIGARKRRPPK